MLTGSSTSNSFSLALLDGVYPNMHGRAHVNRKLTVGVGVAICTQLSLWEAKVSTSVCSSRGVHVLTAIPAGRYRVGSSAQEPLMAFALLADLSVGLEWCPTEPTHLLSNIYKCHGAKACSPRIFCRAQVTVAIKMIFILHSIFFAQSFVLQK